MDSQIRWGWLVVAMVLLGVGMTNVLVSPPGCNLLLNGFEACVADKRF